MTKAKRAADPAPTYFVQGMPDEVAANIRVVDAATGDEIVGVIEANADTGKLSRYEVEDGNLVRKGDAFVVVDEKRDIRIEWRKAPIAVDEDVTEAQG